MPSSFFLTFLFSSQSAAWANTHPEGVSVFEPLGVDANLFIEGVFQNVSTCLVKDEFSQVTAATG